jgi:hypothetical protein
MRTAIAGLSLPWIVQVPSSLEPRRTVGFHTDIDSNQILFAHMPDTMWMGMPA